jgi:trans-aconitate methyltransferase
MLTQLITAFAALLGVSLLHSEDLTMEKRLELWNASDYAKNSKVQESHSERFFDFNSLFGCHRLLDVGCSDGRLTASLAKYLKNAEVIGIDSCQDMIDHAIQNFPKKQYTNLSFEKQTAQQFHFEEPFDYIISIMTMHWIKEQKETLKNIYNHLAPNGKVFFLFAPSKEGLPFDKALKKTTKEWDGDFKNFVSNQSFYDTETYRRLLVEAGLHVDGIYYIFTECLHDNKEILAGWIKQWLPHYKMLPIETKDKFLTRLVDNYLNELPLQKKEGPILWEEYVLIVKASKRDGL